LAVAIECYNVVILKSALEKRFPGGVDGFARQDLINLTEDDHLVRVGYMASDEADGFVSELQKAGLRYFGLAADSDLAIVVEEDDTVPPWLCCGRVDGHRACWARDHPPGKLAWPEPGFLLHCPHSVYQAFPDLARRCGAELREVTVAESEWSAILSCVRGEAELTIFVVDSHEAGGLVCLLGRRDLTRRRQFDLDVALNRDLATALLQAGAGGRVY
jgi:hypothetical protein